MSELWVFVVPWSHWFWTQSQFSSYTIVTKYCVPLYCELSHNRWIFIILQVSALILRDNCPVCIFILIIVYIQVQVKLDKVLSYSGTIPNAVSTDTLLVCSSTAAIINVPFALKTNWKLFVYTGVKYHIDETTSHFLRHTICEIMSQSVVYYKRPAVNWCYT